MTAAGRSELRALTPVHNLGGERTPRSSRRLLFWIQRPPGLAAFHLATRLLTLIAFAVGARREDHSFPSVLTAWDGTWYEKIARSGYPDVLPTAHGHVVTNPAGFFPLLPLLLHVPLALGIPYWAGALVEELVFSTCAALLIAVVVTSYTSRRVGALTAMCWSVFPTASVLSAAYSEALFTLLAAATLLFLGRRQWISAGVAAALAGATRPTGVVVAAAVACAVLLAVLRRREWRSLAALVVAPLGTIGSLAYIGLVAHRWDAWSVTEREGWHVQFDGGQTFARWAVVVLAHHSNPVRLGFVVLVATTVLLALVALIRRPPPAIAVYLVLGTFLAIGQGGEFYLSALRFVLPVFPLLVPAASWLDRRRPTVVLLLLAGAALISAVLGIHYFATTSGAP